DNILLYGEVDGVCPLCTKELMYVKEGSSQKKYEIAHIYPLNATKEEKELLKNEEVISEDLNSLLNVILVCIECHNKFDNPRTVKEYKQLLALKKICIKKGKIKNKYVNYQIEEEIIIILNQLHLQVTELESTELSLNALKIDEKADNTLSKLTKRAIKNNVTDYFLFVKNQFAEIDKINEASFETIAIQVKSMYMQLQRNGCDQEEIYTHLSDWINKKTSNISLEASKIVVSFFIQNCEVFS
ncbi:HNH endonuclease, partial [Paenibacillus sp. CFBP13512]|uniref:ABC-three component system protein n=1 Tax=Paenibacillus sp. CFBP13512 TaxID=2184007 RepID=UPI001138353F